MFNSLTGIITHKLPQTVYLQVGGIEWDILVPDSALDALPPVENQGKLYTWLYHKDDGMRMFGFASIEERSVFLDLMKVEGVGPKAAIKILSSISAQQLAQALESEDLARLEAISGIGKKTAQKMLLALKGKLSMGETETITIKKTTKWQDVSAALVQMGYEKKAVDEVVSNLEKELDTAKTKSEQEDFLFRRAIMELAN